MTSGMQSVQNSQMAPSELRMNNNHSPNDDDDQPPELTPEEELLNLQRRYKNMENERKIFAEEASAQLKRHKVLIEKLNRENESMREELQIEMVQNSKDVATKGSIKASTASLVAKQQQ